MNAPDYTQGGWIPGGPVLIRLDPDECLMSAADVKNRRLRCSRADHPTPTSDCGKPGAWIEPPEKQP